MKINLCHSIRLSKLFFINYILLVGALAFSSEKDDHPHVVLPSPPIPMITISIQHNQVAPIIGDSRYIVSPTLNYSPPSSMGANRQSTPSSDAVVAININHQGGRRGALIPQPLTEEHLERLIKCGKALSKKTPHLLPASDSVFENILGVSTFKDLLTTRKGLLGLSAIMALLFVSYDITNSNQAVLEFKFFKEICNLKNYYPYQAMQDGNIGELLATGPLYLLMFPGLMISYGALCHDVCKKRIPSFVKGCCRQEENKLLHNPKNAYLITFSSIVSALGSGTVAMAKLYGFYQLIQYAGTSWGDKAQLFSYSYYFLSTYYTLFDTSTTYIHSKIHQNFNGDDQIIASNRSTLLNITQNAITKWMALPEREKIQSYNQYFVSKAGDTDVRRFYRMLFFLFDFGQTDVLIQRPAETKTRKALRWTSDGVAVAAGYFSFGYFQHGVQSLLDGTLNYFGVQDYDKGITKKTASGLASIGSGFAVAIARNIGKAVVQGYDAWTGYKDIDEVASSLYANTSSGYTSHPKHRKYLTTYNQISGAFLGISTAKNVFDASSTGERYPAAVLAGITSSALEALFLQRWMHRMVNVADKVGFLKSKSDPVGMMSDYVMEFMREFHLDVTQARAEVVRDMYAIAAIPGLRIQLTNSFQQNGNV